MEPRDVIREIQSTNAVLSPWHVLVQHGRVVRVLDPEDPLPHSQVADRHARESGRPVVVYDVDSRLPPPPAPATVVDPTALGWVEAYRMPAEASAADDDPPPLSVDPPGR